VQSFSHIQAMDSHENIQSKTMEEILREELQSLRKENEDLVQQVRALFTQHEPQPAFSPFKPGSSSTNAPEQAQTLPQPPQVQQEPNLHTLPAATATTPPVSASVTLNFPTTPAANITSPSTTADQMEYILKRLRMLEGNQGAEDPTKFCIVTNLEIPKDFKIPDFEKYDGIKGTIDPNVHIQMYCSKMGAYLKNERMMMYYFQESLTGAAIKWYLSLDKKEMRTWNDLASAFLKQYKHNADFAPDKSSLKKLTMNENEAFRSFTLRWRNQAAQIEPPMTEKELVDAFIEVEGLNRQYKFSCANAIDFAHLVRIGARIETALKEDEHNLVNHINTSSTTTALLRKSLYKAPNKGGYQVINQQQQPSFYQMPQHQGHQNRGQAVNTPPHQFQEQLQLRPKTNRRRSVDQYDPLPVSQGEIFKQLHEEGLLAPVSARQLQPPYPNGFDCNTSCEYHGGVTGHATEKCFTLRAKIQELIDSEQIKFND
jgi:hypothetical protein